MKYHEINVDKIYKVIYDFLKCIIEYRMLSKLNDTSKILFFI